MMKHKQQGSTLLVSMVMLVAITLLVVFSIRASNTSLRIAGNTQVQAEASLAAQQGIEQTIEKVIAADDLSLIPAVTESVPLGAATIEVKIKAMDTCVVEKPVLNESLSPANDNDLACFASRDPDRAILSSGQMSTIPSECKEQDWEVAAGVEDSVTGAKVDQVQGVSIRVSSTVTCL